MLKCLALLLIAALLGACADPPPALSVNRPAVVPAAQQEDPGPPEGPAPEPTAEPTTEPSPVPPSPVPPTRVPPTATPLALAQRFRAQPGDVVRQVTSGVVHIRRVTDDPARINVLLFDLTAREFDARVAVGEGWLSGRYRTSSLARQHEALAAVNGDLFSQDGIPQGLTIADSQVMIAPKYRATFAWSRARGPFIGYFTDQWTWEAAVVASDGARAPLALLNTPCPEQAICLFNEAARLARGREGDVKVVLSPQSRVSAIVRERRVEIGPGEQVLQATGAGARWLSSHLRVGDRVELDIRTDPKLSDYEQAISGGPIILRDGTFVQDCMCALRDCRAVTSGPTGPLCEDFSTDWKDHHYLWVRMPRTGIGFDRARQTLIVAVVDGYQRGYSRGMTQEEFAALLREFGADTAMELDGGGSSTMVLEGRVVNRPPDAEGERYVANALVFYWRK